MPDRSSEDVPIIEGSDICPVCGVGCGQGYALRVDRDYWLFYYYCPPESLWTETESPRALWSKPQGCGHMIVIPNKSIVSN